MKSFEQELRECRAINSKILTAAKGVIAAFDAGVFVRSTRSDDDPAWAIKLLPHLRSLAQLSEAVAAAIEGMEAK